MNIIDGVYAILLVPLHLVQLSVHFVYLVFQDHVFSFHLYHILRCILSSLYREDELGLILMGR